MTWKDSDCIVCSWHLLYTATSDDNNDIYQLLQQESGTQIIVEYIANYLIELII